jgi:hypothetical protein
VQRIKLIRLYNKSGLPGTVWNAFIGGAVGASVTLGFPRHRVTYRCGYVGNVSHPDLLYGLAGEIHEAKNSHENTVYRRGRY